MVPSTFAVLNGMPLSQVANHGFAKPVR